MLGAKIVLALSLINLSFLIVELTFNVLGTMF